MASPAAPPMLPPESIDADRYGNTALIIIEAVLVAIAAALVFARLYVRQIILSSVGFDELFIVIGLIFSIACFVVTAIMVQQRMASVKNGPPLYVPEILVGLKWQALSQPLSILSVTFTRISICFFLLRIFRTDRAWRWCLYSIAVFSAVTGIATAVVTVTQCQPAQKLWDPLLPGTCWSPETTVAIGDFQGGMFSKAARGSYGTGDLANDRWFKLAVAVTIDWVLATLPIVILWNVQMDVRLKSGILILMSMGYFTGICTIVKTVLLKNIVLNKGDGSVTWGLVDLAIWVVLEENVGIIAASIPTLRPLFNKAIREGRKSGRSSNGYLGRSNQNHYIRKTSGDPTSRQLDDKSGLHQVELGSVQPTITTPRTDSFDKNGITVAGAFPSDEGSFESGGKRTESLSKRVNDGGYYEHEEEVFDRV